jgi:hypothetical protein
MGYQATTPGQPSMGYPAMGQPGQQPAANGPAAQNPIMGALNYFNPIGSAQAAEGPGVWNMRHGMPDAPDIGGLVGGILGAASEGQPTDAGALVGAGDTTLKPGPSILPQARGRASPPFPAPDIGAYPDSTSYPHNLKPPTFAWPDSSTPTGMPSPTPPGSPSAPPRPADSNAKGPLASSDGSGGIGSDARFPLKRRAGAPNLGYYSPNPRFGTVQYQTPNSSASRAPIYTALNLFGGGGQPAANPNVPAANAQPASASVPGPLANAPMPPTMPDDIRRQRAIQLAAARSGFA